ncbi:MAG: hypothetical protein ACM34M_03085 [Ignavibacteria bacterium]
MKQTKSFYKILEEVGAISDHFQASPNFFSTLGIHYTNVYPEVLSLLTYSTG